MQKSDESRFSITEIFGPKIGAKGPTISAKGSKISAKGPKIGAKGPRKGPKGGFSLFSRV